MSQSAAIGIFGRTAGRSARRLVLPVSAALALAVFTAYDPKDVLSGAAAGTAIDTLALWLHLPALLVTAFAIGIAIEDWPMFGRDRDDRDWVAHAVRSPWRGCVVVSAGVLVPLAVGLAAVGGGFALLTGAWHEGATPARIHIDLVESPDDPLALAPNEDVLELQITERNAVASVILRPRVLYRAGDRLHAAPIHVEVDDGDVARARFELFGSGTRLEVPIRPPRALHSLRITRELGASGPAITFGPQSLELVLEQTRPRILNAACAAMSYLFAGMLGLAVSTLLRGRAASGISIAAGLGVAVSAVVAEFVPTAAAVRACAHGRWIFSEPLDGAVLISVGLAALLFLAAGFGPQEDA